jgi:hypothetical protein
VAVPRRALVHRTPFGTRIELQRGSGFLAREASGRGRGVSPGPSWSRKGCRRGAPGPSLATGFFRSRPPAPMRTRTLGLPENLALDDVADVATRLGAPTDRTTVARALRAVAIRGVKEPETPRARWRIPRHRLHEAVGACLLRREARKPGWRHLEPETFVWIAAESMLADPELEAFVPRRLRAEILERQRLEAEERARAERRARREKAAAERRERERQERAERARVVGECYWRCRVRYLHAFWGQMPVGMLDWKVEQEETFDPIWPRDRPRWWLPPPALFDAMRDFLRRRDAVCKWLDFDVEVPGWGEWLPVLTPGEPWPWHSSDAATSS